MADRTYFQMQVFACPPDQIEAFMSALQAEIQDLVDDLDLTKLPATYEIDEVHCGIIDEINGHALVAAAPGATWEMWEDPKFEWLGAFLGYHPESGLVAVDCDANGDEVVTYDVAERKVGREIADKLFTGPQLRRLLRRDA